MNLNLCQAVLHTFVWFWWNTYYYYYFLVFATFFLHFTGKNVLCSCAIKWVFFMLFWKFKKCSIKFNPFEMHSHRWSFSFFTFFLQPICPIYMEWPYMRSWKWKSILFLKMSTLSEVTISKGRLFQFETIRLVKNFWYLRVLTWFLVSLKGWLLVVVIFDRVSRDLVVVGW